MLFKKNPIQQNEYDDKNEIDEGMSTGNPVIWV